MSISSKQTPLTAPLVILLALFFSARAEVDLRVSHGIRGLSQVSPLNTNNDSVQNELIRTLKEDKAKEPIFESEDDDDKDNDEEDNDDEEDDLDDEENGDDDDADIVENDEQNGVVEEAFEEAPEDNDPLLEEDDTLVVPEFVDDDDATLGGYPVETQVPPISETFVPTSSPTATQTEAAAAGFFNVALASFTISLNYGEPINADPGIEEYLTNELVNSFGNLVAVYLEFSNSFVKNDGARRNLLQQVLSYAGSATFEGDPFRDEEEVQSIQASILTDRLAVSTVIAESLGTDPNTFAISAVESQNDVKKPDNCKDSDANGGVSTTGLILVIIAVVVGAASLPVIWLAALPKKDPNAVDVKHGLRLAHELVGSKKAKGKLGATFDTARASLNCDDLVHEEFTKNMETHSFAADWEPGSTSPQAASLDKRDSYIGEAGQVRKMIMRIFKGKYFMEYSI